MNVDFITQHLYNCNNRIILLHNHTILLHSCMIVVVCDHSCIFCTNLPTQVHDQDKFTAFLQNHTGCHECSARTSWHVPSSAFVAIFWRSKSWLHSFITVTVFFTGEVAEHVYRTATNFFDVDVHLEHGYNNEDLPIVTMTVITSMAACKSLFSRGVCC